MTADAMVIGAHANGMLDLEFSPPATCSGCSGACLMRRLESAYLDGLRVHGSFRVGDRVEVSLAGHRLLLASLVVYGMPLAALISGATVGAVAAGTDIGALAGAGVAIGAVLVVFGRWRERIERAILAGLAVSLKA